MKLIHFEFTHWVVPTFVSLRLCLLFVHALGILSLGFDVLGQGPMIQTQLSTLHFLQTQELQS